MKPKIEPGNLMGEIFNNYFRKTEFTAVSLKTRLRFQKPSALGVRLHKTRVINISVGLCQIVLFLWN
jgi:hypothetical protein